VLVRTTGLLSMLLLIGCVHPNPFVGKWTRVSGPAISKPELEISDGYVTGSDAVPYHRIDQNTAVLDGAFGIKVSMTLQADGTLSLSDPGSVYRRE